MDTPRPPAGNRGVCRRGGAGSGARRQLRQRRPSAHADGGADDDLETFDAAEAAAVTAAGPLMVCVHDADGGDVSILHGTEEIVVRDRRLVAKIVRAKSGAKSA